VIATERLLLRQWRDGDRTPFAAMGEDPEVMRHFPSLLTPAESEALVDGIAASIDARGYGFWAVERRSDCAFLGFTGIGAIGFPCTVEGEIEIGWRLARDAWGHGYASEAARAALAWSFANLDVPRVVAFTARANSRSQAVMRRIGMVPRPELDFDHPRVAEGSPFRRHVVFSIDRATGQPAPSG
jgi:RimJ/RimL family protein N-acetyltransferase